MEVAGPGAGAGERQAGFVSAVAGGAGLAAPDGVLALANISDPDRAGLAVAGLANPAPVSSRVMAAAASVAAFSDSGSGWISPGWPVAVVPKAMAGSGAEAPYGLAGPSGRPLPSGRDSAGGGTAARGMVTSERWPPGTFESDGRSGASGGADEPAAGKSSAKDDPSAAGELSSDEAAAAGAVRAEKSAEERAAAEAEGDAAPAAVEGDEGE